MESFKPNIVVFSNCINVGRFEKTPAVDKI